MMIFTSSAQRILLLKNGDSIKFKKMKKYPDQLGLKIKGQPEPLVLDINNVESYIYLPTRQTHYVVPKLSGIAGYPEKFNTPYDFLIKRVSGKINIYEKRIAYTTNVSIYLFIETENDYSLVYEELLGDLRIPDSNRKQIEEKIRVAIDDDPETLEIFLNDFDYKYESLIKLFNLYNKNTNRNQ